MDTKGIKVVILAGGLGTRIAEESDVKPKPMIEIGGKPLIHYIMEHYAKFGFKDFIICVGYKGEMIREYFNDLKYRSSKSLYDFTENESAKSYANPNNWTISIIDTGLDTFTGGRLKRVSHLLGDTFFMTYGDGVSTVNIEKQLAFHKSHDKLATILAVHPPSRFAVLKIDSNNKVVRFREKPKSEVGWVNGGFFILQNKVIELIADDNTIWERTPLEQLTEDGELVAFRHTGFWQALDTIHDKRLLEQAYIQRIGPWLDN